MIGSIDGNRTERTEVASGKLEDDQTGRTLPASAHPGGASIAVGIQSGSNVDTQSSHGVADRSSATTYRNGQ
jgi:hypothetical protein